ncbi:MAG: hypothetical protein ACI81O_001496 [Cyclobacteriaceae bacterium]|jgi:hypothetical protein
MLGASEVLRLRDTNACPRFYYLALLQEILPEVSIEGDRPGCYLFGFIVSDSEYIYCHGDRRTHADGIRPPGLHYLSRSCKTEPQPAIAEGLSISTTAESQDILLVASVPLTDEGWRPFEPGQMLVLKDGFVLQTRRECLFTRPLVGNWGSRDTRRLEAIADLEFELMHFNFDLLRWIESVGAADCVAWCVHHRHTKLVTIAE